jgi:hypothetical protein
MKDKYKFTEYEINKHNLINIVPSAESVKKTIEKARSKSVKITAGAVGPPNTLCNNAGPCSCTNTYIGGGDPASCCSGPPVGYGISGCY